MGEPRTRFADGANTSELAAAPTGSPDDAPEVVVTRIAPLALVETVLTNFVLLLTVTSQPQLPAAGNGVLAED